MTASETLRRSRNARATRDAILQAASLAFTRNGYDGIGVREIAASAGVTAILVNRYFGSKEGLFSAVIEVAFSDGSLFSGDLAGLANTLAMAIVEKADSLSETVDPLLLMLRSAPNPRAAEIIRAGVERHFERDLAKRLPGDFQRERSALILSVIAGFQLMRGVIGDEALRDGDRTAIAAHLETILATLIAPKR